MRQGKLERDFTGRTAVESDNGLESNGWELGVNATLPWGKVSDKAAYELALARMQKIESTATGD